jgi:tRNA A-37 threonylcarbamoyl transferase component Bud32
MDRAFRIGRYLTRRTLGAGSFATVWLALDEILDAEVAVKVLADNWARNPDVRRRFIDEAKLMRRIDHDRVVRVHDVDELPDGRPFFVMTWADRGTLNDRLQSVRDGRPMPVAEAVRLTMQVCECLAVVHDFGAVHRDVKPSNVLFRSVRAHERAAAQRRGSDLGDEQVVLGDFGLAKDMAAASGFTQAAGTPAYMAPEQALTTGIIDNRVDVYGAAAVLYEMLTGRPPLGASTLSGVRRDTDGSAVAPIRSLRPDVPSAVAAEIQRAMAHSASQRHSSVIEFAAALEAATPTMHSVVPSNIASALAPTGALGRVADLIARVRGAGGIDPVRLARIEALLASPVRVVIADPSIPIPPNDPRIVVLTSLDDAAESDLVVIGAHQLDSLDALPRGPVFVVGYGTVDAAHPQARRVCLEAVEPEALAAVIANLVDRAALIRASRAAVDLAGALHTTASSDLFDAIDALHTELPALAELDLLRSDTAKPSGLAQPMRRDARRLFFWNTPADRLGTADGDPAALKLRVEATLDRWRRYEQDGRVPFDARALVALAQQSLERLWLDVSS